MRIRHTRRIEISTRTPAVIRSFVALAREEGVDRFDEDVPDVIAEKARGQLPAGTIHDELWEALDLVCADAEPAVGNG